MAAFGLERLTPRRSTRHMFIPIQSLLCEQTIIAC
jgi:hypothetical protein